MPHKLDQIPPGFRPVLWSEVSIGEIVYIQDASECGASGPLSVVDPERKLLRPLVAVDNMYWAEEELLYKDAPTAVLLSDGQKLLGVYVDVPLDLIHLQRFRRDINDCSLAAGWSLKCQFRALPPEAIPKDFANKLSNILQADWRGEVYGCWDLVRRSADADGSREQLRKFTITHRLATHALMVELVRWSCKFSVRPLDADRVEFTVDEYTYRRIVSELNEMLEGVKEE